MKYLVPMARVSPEDCVRTVSYTHLIRGKVMIAHKFPTYGSITELSLAPALAPAFPLLPRKQRGVGPLFLARLASPNAASASS